MYDHMGYWITEQRRAGIWRNSVRVRQKETKQEDDKNKTEPLAQVTVAKSAETVWELALAVDLSSSTMPINVDLSRENSSLSN